MWSLQCAVCSVQCAVWSVKCIGIIQWILSKAPGEVQWEFYWSSRQGDAKKFFFFFFLESNRGLGSPTEVLGHQGCLFFLFCGWQPQSEVFTFWGYLCQDQFNMGQDFNATLVSKIFKGVGMTIFIQKLSKLGSNCSQYDSMCRRRLSIFFNQGHINEHCRRPQIVIDEDVFSPYFV